MNGNQNDDVLPIVQSGSEPVRNDSERSTPVSDGTRKRSEGVPKRIEIRSEVARNTSEENLGRLPFVRQAVPHDVEELRNHSERQWSDAELLRNDSEVHESEHITRSEFVRNDAESVRSSVSERYRTAPTCAPHQEAFSITVREAARIFDEAGVPRTERAITNWCNRNGRGITRLDACYNEEERKYYITPESIERVIKEERKKFQYLDYKSGGSLSPEADDLSEQLRNERKDEQKRERGAEETAAKPIGEGAEKMRFQRQTGNVSTEPEEPSQKETNTQGAHRITDDERSRLKELQMANYELRVQLEGQKYLVRQFDSLVDGERERHEREKLALVDRLTEARHQIGSLETKLLQLEAPKGTIRDAETAPKSAAPHTRNAESPEVPWRSVA